MASRGPSRYEVERTLGRGGMATVYLARDTVLGRHVALKVLADHLAEDEGFRARFLREARLAARLSHPNVVRVYDAGDDERGLSIVMEYVEGEPLDAELRRRGPLPPDEVVELGVQLCSALEAAHAAGLVHRDVKPQNILRARDGTVKLTDFGIARSLDSTVLTEHGSVLGTAAYLAPEQARGEPVTGAADLYGLGVVLYEALTGRRPHEGASLSELVLRREQEAPRPPSAVAAGVPPELDAPILRSLALRPEDRPASAAVLAAELAAALPEAPTRPLPTPTAVLATDVASAPTVVARPAAARSSRRLGAALALLALAGVAGAVAVLASRDSGGGTAASTRADVPATTAAQQTTQPATTTQPPPTTTRPRPAVVAPTCDRFERRRDRLEERTDAFHEQRKATKDKAVRRLLDEQKRAVHDQRKALDRQQKDCDDDDRDEDDD
jgi:predicted Ser/Thr protein kinase